MAAKLGFTDNKANNNLLLQLAFTGTYTNVTNCFASTIAAGQITIFENTLPLLSTESYRFILGVVHYIAKR